MAGDQRVVLDTRSFLLSRAKQTTDTNRRKFTANLQGIVANLPRIRSAKTCTPRQRHQHHRRGITTPEVQSSYHGITALLEPVFSSLARKVDIKLLPQKSNRKDSTRATVDGRLPKLTQGTPLRLRVALRKSESSFFSNYCPKVSFAKPIREANDNCKLCGGGMLQRVGDARCCNKVICRCFCQRCDLESGRHCVTSTVPGQGQRAGHITPRQRNIATVKQNFVSDANIYFPFNGYSPRRPHTRQHVQMLGNTVIAPKTELKRQKEDLRPPPEYGTLGTLELRARLPVVEEGSEVLFRSTDDGWYYSGTVSRDCTDYMYIITDGYCHQEQVWREDIISDSDRKSQVTIGQKVVTQHPRFAFSYAPGEVVAKEKGKVKVILYDGKTTEWTYDFAPLTKWKYDRDVTFIAKMREQWLGEPVIARIPSGTYEFGTVSECVNGHQYKVTWTPMQGRSNSSIVDVRHLFGSLTPYREIQRDGYVLAPLDSCYLPAKVTVKNEGKMKVAFVENSVSEVEESDCFWISPSYYYDAVAVYFNARMREGDCRNTER
ncbi:uncharacterized protein LOC124270550 [Haliotis rubra]|uniref:uncharacterized protein LOC124270550 n=1 Tax=Haliotis rubra TaxID=36100 RepID=UPI001EE51A93|nr:uncharacterized protein LOC124270550 [Haliotis rubra]